METGPKPKDETGSSLVEVMFAAVVVIMFVGALLMVSVQQGHHRRVNLETSLAMNAALDNLERVRSVPIANLPALNGTGFAIPGINGSISGGLPALPGDLDGLPGEFEVVLDQSSAGVSLYRVTASVVWRGANHARRISVVTLIGERK